MFIFYKILFQGIFIWKTYRRTLEGIHSEKHSLESILSMEGIFIEDMSNFSIL